MKVGGRLDHDPVEVVALGAVNGKGISMLATASYEGSSAVPVRFEQRGSPSDR
jgi:hypothetical protein